MEVLKELMEVVKDMPDMALWVLVGFAAYKLFVVGSIYGIIRLIIVKAHSIMTKEQIVKKEITLDGMCITSDGTEKRLIAQIDRLRSCRKDFNPASKYIHSGDVDWLQQAIDEKKEKDRILGELLDKKAKDLD